MVKSRVIFWILFIMLAAGGGLLGYYFALGEPTVFSDQYLKDEVMQAANTDVILAQDANIEIGYTYKMCGHKEKIMLTGDARFTGKTAKEIKSEYPNTNIREFGEHNLVMQMDVDEYCPQHYIIKLNNGKVGIYKTSRSTGTSDLYLDLKLDATAVKQEEIARLEQGVVFENTTDVNNYLYDLKN